MINLENIYTCYDNYSLLELYEIFIKRLELILESEDQIVENLEVLEKWNDYFKEVAPELELKYLDKLNEVRAQLDKKANKEEIKKFQKIIRKPNGKGDNGAALGVVINVPDNYELPICGFVDGSHMSRYTDRDNVALYAGAKGKPNDAEIYGCTFSIDSVRLPTNCDIGLFEVDMYLDTFLEETRHTAIVSKVDEVNNIVTVKEGWFKVQQGGSSSPSIPPDGAKLVVNMATKVWGLNVNAYLSNGDDTNSIAAAEFGVIDNTTSGDTTSWGVDIVNLGSRKADIGLQVRGQTSRFSTGLNISEVDKGIVINHQNNYACKPIVITDGENETYITEKGGVYTTNPFLHWSIDNNTNRRLVFESVDGVLCLRPNIASDLPSDLGHVAHPYRNINMNGSIQGEKTSIGVGTDGVIRTEGNIIATNGSLIASGAEGCVKINKCAWNEGHLWLGQYHLWIDGMGKLRIKNGPPSNDYDGELVGV